MLARVRLAWLVVIAAAAFLAAAAPAAATSLDRDVVGPGDVRYLYVGGDAANAVTVSRTSGGLRIEDAAGGIALDDADGDGATARCRVDDTNAAVICPDDATFIDIALLGGDDRVAFVVGAGGAYAGATSISGDQGNDTITGGAGQDAISGGAGEDAINGALGDDVVRMRDAVAEAADCGGGADSVTADAADALTGCENVDLPGPALPAPSDGVGLSPMTECSTPSSYPGDDAPKHLIARWMASAAAARGIPHELPVMAALVESGLRNSPAGQTLGRAADSVGFFQMRVGIWDRGEYAAYPQQPDRQVKWFIDQAIAVKQTRITVGDAGFGLDPMRWGNWIADVERPSEADRLKYQLRLDDARTLIIGGCVAVANALVQTASQPIVSGLHLTPRTLRAARRGPSATAKAGPAGTRVSYALSFPSAVRFTLRRATSGRAIGGRCVKLAPGNRDRRRCTRTESVRGSFTRSRPSGPDGFTFSGRIGNRTLRPGRYLFVATPHANGKAKEDSSVWIRVSQPWAGANSSSPTGSKGAQAVATARSYLGTPYLWGGSSPNTGFDCAGFVQWAYAQAGVKLARTAAGQYAASKPLADRRQLLIGDLVFFRDTTDAISHVGISLGSDKFISARPGDAVRVARLDDAFYARAFAGARRITTSNARAIDPAQFGVEGTGGPPSRETRALLRNPNVVLAAAGKADLSGGRIDPRVVAVLTALAETHKIHVSSMSSDHSKLTPGGSVTNHYHGRGMDIAAIDGQPIGPANTAARAIAQQLADLDRSIRPDEIGTPWNIPGPGYFTDAGHQDKIAVAFRRVIDTRWRPLSSG